MGLFGEDKDLIEDVNALIEQHALDNAAIVTIGVDALRSINSRYGYEAGNQVIEILIECIENCIDYQRVYRVASKDTFVIVDVDCSEVHNAKKLYYRIRDEVESYLRKIRFAQVFTISAGVLMLDGTLDDYWDMQYRCEFALYTAKMNGKNCAYVFEESKYSDFARNAELLNNLKAAVDADFEAFEVYYQPIVDVENYMVSGAEALLRLHDNGKLISPAVFIPVLEESGLIVPVGLYVMEQAMLESKRIRKEYPSFTIHVNLSYIQFKKSDILRETEKLLKKTGADPKGIIFEITESGFLMDDDRLQSALRGFRNLGIRIALDDFGTGYSNFIYLKNSNIDIVKLDKAFVNGAINNEVEHRLLKRIIDIVHELKLRICLEGIETMSEMTIFRADNPDSVQGFVFGRPVPIEEFYREFIEKRNLLVFSVPENTKARTSGNSAKARKDWKTLFRNGKKLYLSKQKYYTLLGSILPLMMAMIIILTAAAATFSYNVINSYTDKNAELLLGSTEEYIDLSLNQACSLAESMANQVASDIKYDTASDYEKMLVTCADSNKLIIGCGLWFEPYAYDKMRKYMGPYALKEKEKISVIYSYSNNNYDYFSQYYYQKVKAEDEMIITVPYYDETMNHTISTIATPIHDEYGNFRGCVTADITIETLQEIVTNRNARYRDNGEFMLLGRYGEFITGDTSDEEFRNNDFRNASPQKREAVKSMITGDEGSSYYEDETGSYRIYYKTLSELGWKLVLKVDVRENNKGMLSAVAAIIVISLFSLCITIIIIMKLARRMEKDDQKELRKRRLYDETQLKAMQSAFEMIASINLATDVMFIVYKSVKGNKLVNLNESSFARHCEDYSRYVHEDNLEDYLMTVNPTYIIEELTFKSYISCEYKVKIDNEYTWNELIISKAKMKTIEDQDYRFIYMIRDINERKLNEEMADIEKQMLIKQLQNANKVLFQHGMSDSLTNVYNREGLEYYSPKVINMASEPGMRLFFMLADVNRLKLINDTFGHLSGDKAIKMVGEVLTSMECDSQVCARIGGDEFVYMAALDENTDVETDVKGYFVDILEKKNSASDLEFGVTFSLGSYWGKPLLSSTLDDYIRIADRRMYRMKKSVRINN